MIHACAGCVAGMGRGVFAASEWSEDRGGAKVNMATHLTLVIPAKAGIQWLRS